MADGFFDSDSGSSGGDYNDYSYHDYGGYGGNHDGPWWVYVLLALIIGGIGLTIQSCGEAKREAALERERQLDRTVYHAQAQENFKRYVKKRPYQWRESIIHSTLWIEPGSSHRDNGYHCKGIQFDTRDGQSHTLCCNVKDSEPACIRL